MSDEDPTGTCLVCQVREPYPEMAPVCGPCRSRLAGRLGDIPDLCAELAHPPDAPPSQRSEDLRYPAGHPRAGTLVPLRLEPVPAALVPGESGSPRVAGSREASVPISLDRTDLLSAARSSTSSTTALAYPEQDDDQIGYLSAATILDGWCRDFAETRRESVPEPNVTAQCRYLRDRLDWACTDHPAVDEMATEVDDLWHVLRRAAGRTDPKPSYLNGVPCKRCRANALWRVPGSEYAAECGACGWLPTDEEYAEHLKFAAGAARWLLRSDSPAA